MKSHCYFRHQAFCLGLEERVHSNILQRVRQIRDTADDAIASHEIRLPENARGNPLQPALIARARYIGGGFRLSLAAPVRLTYLQTRRVTGAAENP